MSSETTHEDDANASQLEESAVTMLDVLEQEKEMEEEYAAVLGGSDEKCCTFELGAVKRQALYSCLTCCPEAKKDLSKCAGICLACCYKCHENHDLIELYTKRDFRCDCPTERIENNCCLLNPKSSQPQPPNKNNLYNHNFQGLYCKCKKPYPDPDRTIEEIMLQCAVCEDWFHPTHMEMSENDLKLVDICTEMICDMCMEKCSFLQDYKGIALKTVTNEEKTSDIAVTDSCSLELSEEKLSSDLDTSVNNIMKMNDDLKKEEEDKEESENDEPLCKKMKVVADKEVSNSDVCKRPTRKTSEKGPTFWGNDLRTSLCSCKDCVALYKAHKVEFLLDIEDSSKAYEEKGMKRAEKESSSYDQAIKALASMERTTQIDAISEYNSMKDKLKDYLHTFVVNKKIVTEQDIRQFFETIKNEKKSSAVGQPPFFCG